MWTLTVGGEDLTSYVTSLNLTETASSSSDTGTVTVNGSYSVVVPGASVILTDDFGNTAWEGVVTGSAPYATSTGISVATAASNCAVASAYGSSSGNDVALLAQSLLSATSIPWGGPSYFGIEVGGLSFDRVDNGLSLLATLAGSTWRVENGACIFVNAGPGLTSIPVALQTAGNSYAAVNILGGADLTTRIPISTTVTTVGAPSGQIGQVTYHEISDGGTLGILGGNLAEMYGLGSVSATAAISGQAAIRGGDWVQDVNGIVSVAWSVRWSIVAGDLQETIQFGFPSLPTQPQYSQAFSDSMHRNPIARLGNDYLVAGADLSISGLTASLTQAQIVLANQQYAISGATVALLASGTTFLTANVSGAFGTTPASPGVALPLYMVTTFQGNVLQSQDIRSRGGIGKLHFRNVTVDSTNGVWDTPHNVFDHTNAMSHATQQTIGPSADQFGTYTNYGVLHRLHLDVAGSPGGTNLVYNPTASNGYAGWTRFNLGGNQLTFTYDTYGGGRFLTSGGTLGAGNYDGWSENVAAVSGAIAILSLNADVGSGLPAGVQMKADILGGGTELASVIWTNADTGRTTKPTASFSTGSNTTLTVRYFWYNSNGTPVAIPASAFSKIQLEYNTQPSPFVDHLAAANHNKVFDIGANVLKSTTFVANTPNTIAYVSDATIEYSWSGTGPYSVKIWYDNGTAGTDASVIFPDGSPSINLSHTISGSPSYSATGVSSGTNYYVVLHELNGTTTMTVQTTPFTTAAFAAYFADGGIVPAAAQAGTPLFTASGSGGSGGISGGGGGHVPRA